MRLTPMLIVAGGLIALGGGLLLKLENEKLKQTIEVQHALLKDAVLVQEKTLRILGKWGK